MFWYDGQSSVTSLVVGATAPRTKAWISVLPKLSMTFRRARRGMPPSTSTAPATSHLANPTATGGDDDRVILGAERDDRFICLDNAAQRLAIRVTMERRNLAHNIKAVPYEPRPSWLC